MIGFRKACHGLGQIRTIFTVGFPIENARGRGADLEHDLNQLDLED